VSVTSALSRGAIEAVDSAGMLGDVLAQPAQLADALWRAHSAAIPRREAERGLVAAGMGGSAIGGDLAAAALSGRAERPIVTARGYQLDRWIGPDTLVLCASYSGDTEETVASFEAAGAAAAPRVAVTTGGDLARLARDEGVPVIGVPAGFQPRAAVVYMTVAALECAAACGAGPAIREEIEAAAAPLAALAAEWGPDSDEDSLAKRLASALRDTIPVVHGAGPTAAAARRWKCQINENAGAPAFSTELPEADHNEVCGYAPPLAAVFLDDPELDPRLRNRIDLTADLLREGGIAVERVEARGDTPFARLMSLVLLGDLVSVYLAVLAGRDPTPVPAIDRLKAGLG
jgi:glucose/mannose-6-phosphate isomerase